MEKRTHYIESVGRRKTAISRVRLLENEKGLTVNGRSLEEYFPTARLREEILQPLKIAGLDDAFGLSIKVIGGGIKGQAQATRLGLTRCLVKRDAELHLTMKKEGLLSRDARRRERKKFGLRSARRAPQWSKR